MTLVLNNDEISQLLTVPECLARLEETYQDLGQRQALNRPRSDLYAAPDTDAGQRYIFKSMDGLVPRFEVAALRLCSDRITWESTPAGIRKDKAPLANGKWVGLILLFSTRSGEPIAIMPDGVIQRFRVGLTNGIAARYLAPPQARTYALLGSGWQAGAQAMAMVAVRPSLREIRVYSPTRANRERFAAEMTDLLKIEVRPVDDPRAAVEGADIVGMATNSVTPVAEADWLAPQAHVTCIKELELGDGMLERCALVVVHARPGRPANYLIGYGERPIYAHDPPEALGTNEEARRAHRVPTSRVDLEEQPDLGELVTGQVSLPPPGSPTCFVNTMGVGVQFAALGSLAYERARERGLGREIPTDWFLQTEHD